MRHESTTDIVAFRTAPVSNIAADELTLESTPNPLSRPYDQRTPGGYLSDTRGFKRLSESEAL